MRLLGGALATLLLVGTQDMLLAQTVSGPDPRTANAVKLGVDAWTQGNYGKAATIWRPLAIAGDPDAQFNMGQATKLGRGVPIDLTAALEWYRKAAAQGHHRAEDNYGLLLFQQNRRAEAMPYIRKSADRGDPRAQYLLGTALYNGDLAARDWVRAYALMTRASRAGLPQAANSLATMDQYIPEAQRQQGLALATQIEQNNSPAMASNAPVAAAAATPPPVAPTPVYVPPAPKPVALAAPAKAAEATQKPAAAPGGKWRVQLGAFGTDDAAKKLWASLKGKVTRLSSYQPYLVKGGNITRLQAGPLASQAEADKLCSAVKAAGADCLIKKP